jgi:hypothetical protein
MWELEWCDVLSGEVNSLPKPLESLAGKSPTAAQVWRGIDQATPTVNQRQLQLGKILNPPSKLT